jgi:hypothetical protein
MFELYFFFLQGKWSSNPSVLSFIYCIVLSIILFSKEEWRWCFSFKNLHACGGYQVPPSVETECSPYSSITLDRKCYATNIFCSFDMLILRISLLSDSIATNNYINSEEPTLSWVSLIINPGILVLLWNNLSGLYFCIQSLIAVRFLLTNLDIALDVFLNERPLK